ERELVERGRRSLVVIEALVAVGLAVAVVVAQARDAVAPVHVDDAADDGEAERVEQARREALPGHARERIVEAADDPDVAVPGGDRGAAVAEEVERADAHARTEAVVERDPDRVDGPGVVVGAPLALGDDRFAPATGRRLAQLVEVLGRAALRLERAERRER